MNENYKAKKYILAFVISSIEWHQYVASLVLLSAIALLTSCSSNKEKGEANTDSLASVITQDSVHFATTLAEAHREPFQGDPDEFTKELESIYGGLSERMTELYSVTIEKELCEETVRFYEFEDYAKVEWYSMCNESYWLTKTYYFKKGLLFSIGSYDTDMFAEGIPTDEIIFHLKSGILTESNRTTNGNDTSLVLYHTSIIEGGSLDEYYPEVNTVLAKLSVKQDIDHSYSIGDENPLKDALADSAKVSSLNLDWKSLLSVPLDVFKLKKLENLSLVHNELSQLPSEISNLSNLKELTLHDNKLVKLPAALGTLSQLKSLNLAGNKLSDNYNKCIPLELSGLSRLEYLNLSRNDLFAIPLVLNELSSLSSLDLSKNNLSLLPAERSLFGISKLTNLQTLNLSEINLEIFPEGVLQLNNLTYLSFYKNPLSVIPDEIKNLKKLENLDLSETNLTTFPSGVISLKNLKRLDLSYTGITEIPPTIAELSKLEFLSLAGTNFSADEQKKVRAMLSKLNCVVGF